MWATTSRKGTLGRARSRKSSARVRLPLGRSQLEPDAGNPPRYVRSRANTSLFLLSDPDDGGQTREELHVRLLESDADSNHRRIPHPLVSRLRNVRFRERVVGRREEALDDAFELAIRVGAEGHRGLAPDAEIGELVFVDPRLHPELAADPEGEQWPPDHDGCPGLDDPTHDGARVRGANHRGLEVRLGHAELGLVSRDLRLEHRDVLLAYGEPFGLGARELQGGLSGLAFLRGGLHPCARGAMLRLGDPHLLFRQHTL